MTKSGEKITREGECPKCSGKLYFDKYTRVYGEGFIESTYVMCGDCKFKDHTIKELE